MVQLRNARTAVPAASYRKLPKRRDEMPDTTKPGSSFRFDEEVFLRRIPYRLARTNLPGAYTSPAPPNDFDPNAASAGDLVRQGLLWRRPEPGSDARMRAAWDKVFGRKWLAKDRIVPQLHPHVGKTHLLRQKPIPREEGSYLDSTWAGAAIDTGSWTSVIGYWVIPTVSRPLEPQGEEGGWHCSTWVGIDGYNRVIVSDDVLQAGVDSRVDAAGNTSCFAWFEWFAPEEPGSPDYIWETEITNFPVAPGQQVYCSVQYTSNHTAGTLYFANEATGQHFSITLAPPPGASFAGNTIEWILEAPDGGEPISSVPRFTPVTFTSAIGCGPDDAFGNPADADTLNIEDPEGTVLTSVETGTDTVTITFIG
jgi:hypothetical protein